MEEAVQHDAAIQVDEGPPGLILPSAYPLARLLVVLSNTTIVDRVEVGCVDGHGLASFRSGETAQLPEALPDLCVQGALWTGRESHEDRGGQEDPNTCERGGPGLVAQESSRYSMPNAHTVENADLVRWVG